MSVLLGGGRWFCRNKFNLDSGRAASEIAQGQRIPELQQEGSDTNRERQQESFIKSGEMLSLRETAWH